jgi:arylsulfatase
VAFESNSNQRVILPIPNRPHIGLTTDDAKDPETSFPPITPLRPPAGAPNVLIVLLDDVGFAASSAFGGPIDAAEASQDLDHLITPEQRLQIAMARQ